MSSSRLTFRRSKKPATIARYGKTREFAKVVSVIDVPSNSKHHWLFRSNSFSSGCGSLGRADCGLDGLDVAKSADVAGLVADVLVGSVFVGSVPVGSILVADVILTAGWEFGG
jgi:hypothetical protein